MIRYLLLSLVLLSSTAFAKEAKLFMQIPAQITQPEAMEIVRIDTVGRQYKVKDVNANEIEITQKFSTSNVVFRLIFSENEIKYKDLSYREEDDPNTGEVIKEFTSAPNGWIDNLTGDINRTFALIGILKKHIDKHMPKK